METGYANTAAIISFSVQQNADGMLKLFMTDKARPCLPSSSAIRAWSAPSGTTLRE